MREKIAGWFSRRRPRTNSAQSAADAEEDAALALRYPAYEIDRRNGRVRSQSPRGANIAIRRNMRDAEWAAAEADRLAAQPSLARRASQGALNLVQNVSRGVQNVSRGASRRASQGAQIASNYLWGRAAAAAAAARRAIADANDAAARQRLQPAALAADLDNIAAARRAAAAAPAAPVKLTPEQLKNIAKIKVNEPDLELECSVCNDIMFAPDADTGEVDEVALTGCGNHIFHKKCVEEWSKKGDSCPVCRGGLTPFTLVAPTLAILAKAKAAAEAPGGGGFKKKYKSRGRRTRSKSKSRRYPRKPRKTRKV